MHPLYRIVPASMLLLLAGSAGAQTQAYPLTEPEAVSRVEVSASPPAFRFSMSTAESISGAYALSNGWRLKVAPAARGIVARIDGRAPVRLLALSQDRYATRDGNLTMEFNRGVLGDEMLMSYIPDPRTAQVIVVSAKTTLAQR